jgi:transcription antitermination factor NusG
VNDLTRQAPHNIEPQTGIVAQLPEDLVRRWFAIYTASNNEKAVEQHLRLKEVETFLPLHSVIRHWKNRTRVKVDLPLFASYVFVKIARAESAKVLSVPRVYSIVGNGREYSPLPDADIEALRSGLHADKVSPWPYIKVGDRARIVRGPLAGREGIIIRSNDQLRFVISIDAILRSIAVHVDGDDIELVT